MESPIIPLGDKIIILPKEEGEQQYGNIIIPDAGKEKPEVGTVLFEEVRINDERSRNSISCWSW